MAHSRAIIAVVRGAALWESRMVSHDIAVEIGLPLKSSSTR
jgi:hypothetical protein